MMVAPPHGGKLIQLQILPSMPGLRKDALPTQTVRVTPEEKESIYNIAHGILSPLRGFMLQEDYLNVLERMRLASDHPWTIPTLLRSPEDIGNAGDEVTLEDQDGTPLAVLDLEQVYTIDRRELARKVYGTEDEAHPGVSRLLSLPNRVLGGKLKLVFERQAEAFDRVTLYPRDTRVLFREKGWKKIIAFQTRNAPHIGHEYVQKMGLLVADGLFINPVLGRKKQGDFVDDSIISACQALVKNYYPKNSVVLSVLRYEMQYAGPKEAIMHAIMRKNFGCTHIAIGRDHAGVESYYPPYAAQEIFKEFPDLAIEPVLMREFYYCKKCWGIANEKICPHGEEDRLTFSGTQLRKMFLAGQRPPKEFMRTEVADAILSISKPFVE